MCVFAVPWSLRTTLLLILGLLLPLPLMFLSLLARFLLRPPKARRFRSFDKVGRPQLRSHSCASSNVGSTHPSCVPTQQCLPPSFASGVHLSKLDGAINFSGVSPSTHAFYLRYFCFYTCMPLCTPVAQASVYVLVHYAKHHMETCVKVCWALCACACTLHV